MMNHQELLEAIGMSPLEGRVYLQLLSYGENTASKTARELHLPRSTVRGVLDQLCQQDVVTKMYRRNTQYYRAKPPEALEKSVLQEIQQREETLEKLRKHIPQFETLYSQPTVAPKVLYYEGRKQVIEAFNDSLYTKSKELLFFTSYEFLKDPEIRKNDDEFYIPMRIKKGIPLRVIVGETAFNKSFSKKVPKELRERRFLPKQFPMPGNIKISEKRVTHFSASNGEYMAVMIESQLIAQTMRNLFECLWEVSRKSF